MEDKPFSGLRVYYSGAIRGTPETDPELPWKIVSFMHRVDRRHRFVSASRFLRY